jgi:pre-60S factor REI1
MSDFEIVSMSGQSFLTCTACLIEFEDPAAQREHFKQEWHIYNTKRRVAGLQPISEDVWEEKLAKIREQHDQVQSQLAEKEAGKHVIKAPKREWVPPPIDELTCFFDNSRAESLEDNLAKMSLKHSFFIPYVEWVSDWSGLMKCLCSRIIERHRCFTCGKIFKTASAVQGHMSDSGHTRINLDDDELIGELEPFFDFSMKEEIIDELDILEDGSLQLPSGATLTHRDFAYIYKQKVRTWEREKEEKRKPEIPALLNVGPNASNVTALMPAYTLKRLAKQLARAMKSERDRESLRTGLRNNKSMRRSYRSSIVEMYSYGK